MPADSINPPQAGTPPYPQESLLVDVVAEMSGRRLVCTSPGLAQFAGTAAQALPDSIITCTYLDLYRASLASEQWRDGPPNLRIECAADLPGDEADFVALPFTASGDAELTRDLLQSGHHRLRLRGKLYATTDNRRDQWLHAELRKRFSKVERRELPAGVLYIGTKQAPLKKLKDFSCQFAFRDQGRLIHAFSRPGVFSHRHIDPGARHLIDAMEIAPGDHVLDIGCGAGTVALAAACRADGVNVHAIDSNARAIECTQRGAELNKLTNITTVLNADGNIQNAGRHDLALANPPYYAGFSIARHFLKIGRNALRAGGRMLIVTKSPEWYQQNLSQWFDDVSATEQKGYFLFGGLRRGD